MSGKLNLKGSSLLQKNFLTESNNKNRGNW